MKKADYSRWANKGLGAEKGRKKGEKGLPFWKTGRKTKVFSLYSIRNRDRPSGFSPPEEPGDFNARDPISTHIVFVFLLFQETITATIEKGRKQGGQTGGGRQVWCMDGSFTTNLVFTLGTFSVKLLQSSFVWVPTFG